MDSDQIELIKVGLDAYAEHLSPFYKETRDQLNSSLGGVAIENFEEAVKNVALLGSFVELLPHAGISYSDSRFTTGSQAQSRAIQASVLWGTFSWSYHDEGRTDFTHPYYVLGKRVGKSDTKLLLQAAYSLEGDIPNKAGGKIGRERSALGIVSVSRKDAHELAKSSADLQHSAFSSEETPLVYSTTDRNFVINKKSPGSRSVIKANKRTGRLRGHSIKANSVEWLTTLPSTELAVFNVFDYVNDLATLHDVVDEAKNIFIPKPDKTNTSVEEFHTSAPSQEIRKKIGHVVRGRLTA